jgi:hypothetical protein
MAVNGGLNVTVRMTVRCDIRRFRANGRPSDSSSSTSGCAPAKIAAVWVNSVADFRQTVTNRRQSVTDFRRSMTDFRRSVTDIRRSMTGFRQSVADFRRFVADFRRSMTDIRRSVTDFRRSEVHFHVNGTGQRTKMRQGWNAECGMRRTDVESRQARSGPAAFI